MPVSIAVVATDPAAQQRLAALVPPDAFDITTCSPDAIPTATPELFIIALPALATPEEQLIERLRAEDATATIPIVIASSLPMIHLQSVPYASDWTIAIVEEPVQASVLAETMQFLLNPG